MAWHFGRLVVQNLPKDSIVLDAGCGSNPAVIIKSNLVIGVDSDPRVFKNDGIDCLVRADLNHLPFKGGVFGLILCHTVAEHLESPSACFGEFFRVCQDGGKTIIATPNENHYANKIVKYLPQVLKNLFCRFILHSGDDCPTFYRCNSGSKLLKLMGDNGFDCINLHYVDAMPMQGYLGWFTPFYIIGLFYHLIVRSSWKLRRFRGDIFAIFRKGY